MAITFPITGVSAEVTATRDPTFTLGTSPIEDDILVLYASSTTAATTTDVAGWTNVLGANAEVMTAASETTACMVYHRVTAAEDTANEVTWLLDNLWDTSETGRISVTVLRGVATSGELVGTASGSDAAVADPWVIPTVTPTADDCVIIAGVSGDSTETQTTPSGWTLRASGSTTESNYLYTRDTLGSNGTPTGTTNVTPSTADEYVSIVACFKPASTATAVVPVDTSNGNTADAATVTATTAVVPVDTSNGNTADAATVVATTPVVPVDTSNENTSDAATVEGGTTAVVPADTSNANTADAATVTDLTPTAPPTPVELVESEWVQVDAGLDLLDEDGVFVMDISDDLQVEGSSVARVMGNRIHGTCDLVVARRLLWGSQRVRPKITLTDADGNSQTWNLGVYALTTPQRVAGETPETYKVSGYDLLSFLDNPYGSTYSAAVGAVPLTLVASILTALGITNGIDQTAIASTLATAYVRPLDQKNTTLLIVNELLAAIGYGPLWIDRDGRARSGPLTATTATMWVYSADSATTTVGETRTQTADFWGVPNRWVFVRNGTTTAPSEGSGVYTVENVTDGESSQTGRGRVINRVEFLDAVDQTALVAQGDEIVAADRRVVSTISMQVAPNPEHWHADRVTYTDAALGVSGEFKVVEWRLPLDGGDMSVELEAV